MLEIGKNSGGINWVTKSRISGKNGKDILISVTKSGDNLHGSIIFRNKQFNKFKSGYIMFGLAGTRLYLADSNSTDGYKLCDCASSFNKTCKVSNDTFADWCANHRGEYVLDYDSTLGMYYVETNKEA